MPGQFKSPTDVLIAAGEEFGTCEPRAVAVVIVSVNEKSEIDLFWSDSPFTAMGLMQAGIVAITRWLFKAVL